MAICQISFKDILRKLANKPFNVGKKYPKTSSNHLVLEVYMTLYSLI